MMQLQPLININIQDISTVDECDEYIYQLKDIINQLKKKRSELLLEMIESHEYKEIILLNEKEIHHKEYQFEFIQPKTEKKETKEMKQSKQNEKKEKEKKQTKIDSQKEIKPKEKNQLGIFSTYEKELLRLTEMKSYSILFDTNQVGWKREDFNKNVINKNQLMFLCYTNDSLIGFWLQNEVIKFNDYIEDKKFFLFRLRNEGMNTYYRLQSSSCPDDAMLIYSKHSKRWFGCYDCWIQSTREGISTIYPEIMSHFKNITIMNHQGLITSFKVERVVVLQCE